MRPDTIWWWSLCAKAFLRWRCSPGRTLFLPGGLLDAVRKDNYMAVVMYDPQQQRELSDCVTLPITGFSDTLDVCLMRSKSYTLNAREKKFVQFCKKRFQTAHEI